MYYRLLLLTMMLTGVLMACQPVDESVAIEDELVAYGTEVAALRDGLSVDQTQAAATIEFAGTEAADFERYNSELVVTVRAGNPNPTPVRRVVESQGAGLSAEMFNLQGEDMRVLQIGAAAEIDASRCFRSHVEFFQPGTGVIYQTARIINIQPGTTLRVDWAYNGSIVHQRTWTAPEYRETQCVALEMRSENVTLSPGNWTATLYVNGEARDPTPFTILPS
jgi:hypothetical protein